VNGGRGRYLLAVCCASVTLPIYADVSSPYLTWAGTSSAEFSLDSLNVHWSYIMGPLLLVGVVRLSRGNLSALQPDLHPRVGLLLAGWLSVVAFGGAIFSPSGDVSSLLTLAQILIPALFIYLGVWFGIIGLGQRGLAYIVMGVSAAQIVILWNNWSAIRAFDAHGVALVFPQFLTYYPGLLALGVSAAWGLRRRYAAVAAVLIGSLVLTAPVIWSRLGLVVMCVAVIVPAFVQDNPASRFFRTRVRATKILLVCGVLAFAAGLVWLALSGIIGWRVDQRLSIDAGVLQSGRVPLMKMSMEEVMDSPVWGHAGKTMFDRGEFGGMRGAGLRLFPSHNQLLDLGIRGGLLAIALGVALGFSLLRCAIYMYKKPYMPLSATGAAVICVMLVASASDLYFTQALTASPGWFIIGLTLGEMKRAHLSDSKAPHKAKHVRPRSLHDLRLSVRRSR
jgi:hypothetical protein